MVPNERLDCYSSITGLINQFSTFSIADLYQGLCAYVLRNVKEAASRGVVIGHDHRHHSERWARLTAAAFMAKNVKVYLYKGLVHTPM
jgi:phosphoglucomutase